MIGAAGMTATVIGAVSALVGTFVAIRAVQGRWSPRAAERAAWAALGGLGAANVILVVGLVARDFSIAYVAQVGSRETPLLFTVASLWAALEGSILFWAGLSSALTVLLIVRTKGVDDRARLPGAVAVLLALTAFFALIVVAPGNPWGRLSPAPLDGPGPNPLLQEHPLMAIHPPLLYLGFVGLAIPFALTVDALVRGRLDHGWLRLARRWTLGPWVLLTLGLIAGAWWSYAVLGWGGYWAWDPVENVALLPWLTATAFLHSAMPGRRGGSLVNWNVTLVTASFVLTLLATLITRSGVLDSVHAFTRSAIGPLFVGLLAATLVGIAGLSVLHLPERSGEGRLGTRGRAFLVNNLLLAAVALTVLLGTVFPLLVEVVDGARVSVGAPYFERIVAPLAAGILILMGIGPALPWAGRSAEVRHSLLPGLCAAGVVAVLLALLGSPPSAVAGAAVGGFAVAQSIWFLLRRAVRRDSSAGRPRPRLRALSPRLAGGLVSHCGIALLAVAVVLSGAGKREAVVSLPVGASAQVLGRDVTFLASEERPGPDRTVLAARIRIGQGDATMELAPALNAFATATQAIATPAIVPGAIDDLYVTLLDFDATTGVATLRIGVLPFVSWIWPSGALVAMGGALAAWPLTGRRSAVREPAARSGEALPHDPVLDVVAR